MTILRKAPQYLKIRSSTIPGAECPNSNDSSYNQFSQNMLTYTITG